MDTAGRAVSQYLSRYAEPEIDLLEAFPGHFQHLLVVPWYREPPAAATRFCEWLERSGATLMILVSNRPNTDATAEWHYRLTQFLGQTGHCAWNNGVLTLFRLRRGSAVLLVDRAGEGVPLPAREGVGLARKIGADIACYLIANNKVRSPWIANTDADAVLPENYLAPMNHFSKGAALIYAYRHVADADGPLLPTLLYEFGLHYYVEGLRYAGSPYAYHTLGSTLTIRYTHYAQVRGFPRRAGAEDFYLLNKLSKTGSIISLTEPIITLLARHSDRVPFGTGPASARIAGLDNPNSTALYHPDCFTYLKAWLAALDDLAEQPRDLSAAIQQLPAQLLSRIDTDHLQTYGEQIAIEAALQHCYRHGATPKARRRHLHTWFDAFKTMKLINWLRDHKLGTLPFDRWPERAGEWEQESDTGLQARFEYIQSQLQTHSGLH